MAERKRRPAGAFSSAILEILEKAERPMAGYAIVDSLARKGDRVLPSQTFRALRQLRSSNLIHRVELAGGYAKGAPGPNIHLVCDACGKVERVPAPDLFAKLRALSSSQGMATGDIIVESSGLCATCRGNQQAEPID